MTFLYGLLHMDTPVLANQQKSYIHQLCVDVRVIVFAMPTAEVFKCFKEVLKIYIIRLAIEWQTHISGFLYTPLKIQFKQQPLPKFWLGIASAYLLLSQKAVKILLPFTTTYLHKTAFSALISMMTKYKSRLVQNELHLSLFIISPRMDNLFQSRKAHPSH